MLPAFTSSSVLLRLYKKKNKTKNIKIVNTLFTAKQKQNISITANWTGTKNRQLDITFGIIVSH